MLLLDWIIVLLYIFFILGISFFIGRSQKDQDDYYLAGRKVPPWQIGSSMAANQVSAISLIGAPAFIAVKETGGLKWLQYEMAIPLAMIFIIIFLVPLLRSTGGITIYQYLEKRFGIETRFTLSFIFLISRSLATGVALLATSYVTSVCIGLPLLETIIIIGLISFIYTSMGGIKADIISDIIQLVVLWISSIAIIFILLNLLNWDISFADNAADRLYIFDLKSTGIGDGNSFSFWPMLFGGFFLYISYYGCDQSQAQRLLATDENRKASKSLVINSLIRFPLVLTYCTVGILLILFMGKNPEFTDKILSLPPDYLIPHFINDYIPAGLVGLIVAGVFAASMSSLDSAINSLSAATWEDFLVKIFPDLDEIKDRKKVTLSRIITIFWGIFTIAAAVFMAEGADTVIELVNKIGSAFYGPIAGVFILGIILKRKGQFPALGGLISGMTVNIILWLGFSSVSWMWWNLTGFCMTVISGIVMGAIFKGEPLKRDDSEEITFSGLLESSPKNMITALVLWFAIIIISSYLIHVNLVVS